MGKFKAGDFVVFDNGNTLGIIDESNNSSNSNLEGSDSIGLVCGIVYNEETGDWLFKKNMMCGTSTMKKSNEEEIESTYEHIEENGYYYDKKSNMVFKNKFKSGDYVYFDELNIGIVNKCIGNKIYCHCYLKSSNNFNENRSPIENPIVIDINRTSIRYADNFERMLLNSNLSWKGKTYNAKNNIIENEFKPGDFVILKNSGSIGIVKENCSDGTICLLCHIYYIEDRADWVFSSVNIYVYPYDLEFATSTNKEWLLDYIDYNGYHYNRKNNSLILKNSIYDMNLLKEKINKEIERVKELKDKSEGDSLHYIYEMNAYERVLDMINDIIE